MKDNKVKTIGFLLFVVILLTFSTCTPGTGGGEPADPTQVDILTLPPLKDSFADHFMMGNIFNPVDAGSIVANRGLTHHYNVLTAENAMKPNALSTTQGSYNWATADTMVSAARASGFKVVGHTLLWHSQIPSWQQGMAGRGKETALEAMKKFVTDVVTHFKGKIYSWDVLNEAFPDGVNAFADWKTSMRNNNPWFAAIGSDFVYEGFLAARLADPDAILYYNDYNLDNNGKATMVRNMVKDVNDRYKAAYPSETRLLIEGVGMQSHHNTGVSANNVRNSLNLFRALGVRIAISELDVLSQTYQQFSPSGQGPNKTASSTATDEGKERAAQLYGEYFKLFVQNSDIIDRVTFWGVYDEQSWRSAGLPLIFNGVSPSRAKPAYYEVIKALE